MMEFRIHLNSSLIQKTMISKGSILIGRAPNNDLILRNNHVSRLHAVIEQDGDKLRVVDRSSNGILVDGEKISGSAPLPPRFRLAIYPFEIECLVQMDDRTAPIPEEKESAVTTEPPVSTAPLQAPTLTYHYDILVGESPLMQKVYQLIEDVAQSPATILIRGEHGTGKELVAQAIHKTSQRSHAPMIAVNCAAIPLDLIESELFGYEKGAFTGAQTARKGKIEEANQGTLFLDEIAELSPPAQAKLLRFLQSKTFMRLGSAREIKADVRVIAATNKELERAVREEAFRADLYYRIKVIQIRLPLLRERSEDVPMLAAHILANLTKELDLESDPVLTADAMKTLQAGTWPGNVRQFENILYSALLRSRSPYVLNEEIIMGDSPTWMGSDESGSEDGESPMESISKQYLLKILKRNQWDTTKTAETLKVSRGTIYYRMKKYGIDLQKVPRGSIGL